MPHATPAAEAGSPERTIIPFPRRPRMSAAPDGVGAMADSRSGLFRIVLLPLAIAVASLAGLALLMGTLLIILFVVGLLAAAVIFCELVRKYMQHRAKLAAFGSGSMGYPGRYY